VAYVQVKVPRASKDLKGWGLPLGYCLELSATRLRLSSGRTRNGYTLWKSPPTTGTHGSQNVFYWLFPLILHILFSSWEVLFRDSLDLCMIRATHTHWTEHIKQIVPTIGSTQKEKTRPTGDKAWLKFLHARSACKLNESKIELSFCIITFNRFPFHSHITSCFLFPLPTQLPCHWGYTVCPNSTMTHSVTYRHLMWPSI